MTALVVAYATNAWAGAKGKPATVAKDATPQATFDQLLAEAEAVHDLASVIEPLFDNCDNSDPLGYRQCEGARAFLEAKSRDKTYVAIGDAASVNVSPYDANAKELDVDVVGCLACLHPPKLSDGKGGEIPRFVTTKVPHAIKNGHAVGLDVASLQLTMSKPDDHAKWKKQEKRFAPRVRVQFIFKLGQTWSSGTFSGVSFTPLAYRLFDACSGDVLTTSTGATAPGTKVAMPAMLAKGDTLSCPAPGQDMSPEEKAAKEAFAKLPLRLSREEVEKGMAPVQETVHDCHVEFEESGTANIVLLVEGVTGKVREARVLPPFEKTPAGLCIKAALRDATFSRFRGETQEVKLPVYLR
jgi:hypothetical protein